MPIDYDAGMDIIQLFACSGLGAIRAIKEAETYAATLGYISIGIVAISVIMTWMRTQPIGWTIALVAMLPVHPAAWMSAVGGDCGSTLSACSTAWTILVAVIGVGLIVRSWNKKSERLPEQFPES